MKIISKAFKVVTILTLTFGIYSCDDDDNENVIEVEANIAELAQADNDLSSFVSALSEANLVAEFEGSTEFTVLAPSNAAFTAFLTENGWDNVGEVPEEVLRQVLLNHVIAGRYSSSALSAQSSGYLTTESTAGPNDNKISIYYNAISGVSFNGGSNNGGAAVDQADILATNGIIHKVDAVIELPTVVTFASADANFSTLVSALTTLTPSTDFVEILSRTETGNVDTIDPAFTIFAPVNSAFEAITVPTDETELTAILQYHVVSGANVTSSELQNGTVATLNGDVTIDTNGPTVTGSGNAEATTIIATDVQAVNGVIHGIEDVLLPPVN